jgi:hypothetical protein
MAWKATVEVKEVIKGTASKQHVVFGGGDTSCDISASLFKVGLRYAFAMNAIGTDSHPYRLDFCMGGWARLAGKRGLDVVLTPDEVRAAVREPK